MTPHGLTNGEVERFLRPDPIGSKDDFVLYAYVKGNPTNATDPTGTHEARESMLERAGFDGPGNLGVGGDDATRLGDVLTDLSRSASVRTDSMSLSLPRVSNE